MICAARASTDVFAILAPSSESVEAIVAVTTWTNVLDLRITFPTHVISVVRERAPAARHDCNRHCYRGCDDD